LYGFGVRSTRKDAPMNPREDRGLALADAAKISQNGKGWIVPSQTGGTPVPQPFRPLPRDARVGDGAGPVRLTLFRPTAAQIYYGKEVVRVAKARKYHRVKSYPRKGGGRVKPHVRRMPKKCK
jgi:hypothetical protein